MKKGQKNIKVTLNFQAVIKSAASAASRKPKSREGSSRGVQDGGSAGGRRPWGTPLELPSLDLGFLEAVLAANLTTALNVAYIIIIQGYCASSRLISKVSDSVRSPL